MVAINTLPLYNCMEGSPSPFRQSRVVRFPCGREENMRLIYCIIPLYYMYENGAWKLLDHKRYAARPSNFVTGWIWCSGTFLYFFHVHKGNVRHVMARKGRGTSLYTCTDEMCQLPTIVVHLLSIVCVTYNTKKTFSTFSRDLSRSFILFQHCT